MNDKQDPERMAPPRRLADVIRIDDRHIASDAEVARYERGRAESARRELLVLSGVYDVLDEEGREAIVRGRERTTRALTLVRQWLASAKPVLVLFGTVGVGKTVAAASALAAHPGRYTEAADACSLHRDRDRRDEWRRLTRCELLVLDELGTEPNAAHAVETLQAIVNARQALPRRTLIMGNLDGAAFAKRYDPRTVSRLRKQAVFRAIHGTDLRGAP